MLYLLPAIILALLTTFSSCEKEHSFLPGIRFSPGVAYVSDKESVSKNETVVVGIRASKTDENDVLKLFTQSVSYDGATETIIQNIELNDTEADIYSIDIPITTRNKSGIEVYTFSITTKGGLTNTVSLTL